MNGFNKVLFAATVLMQKATYALRPVKRVHLIGDSLMAAQPWHKYPRTGWGTQLHTYLNTDKVQVLNHARNGGSTMDFNKRNYFKRALRSIKENDIVVVGFAHNDAYFNPPNGGSLLHIYESLLLGFINKLKEKNAIIILSTPIIRFNKNPDHGEFTETIRRIAAKEDILLLDLYGHSQDLQQHLSEMKSKELYLIAEAGSYIMYPDGIQDIIHLSPFGGQVFAKFAADKINALL